MKRLLACVSIILFSVISFADLPKLQDLAPPLNTNVEQVRRMYAAALKNLDQQFVESNDGTVYVSTGDIRAEWLRDSSVQVRPFLFFAKNNPAVANLIKGVVLRQARNILIDPYANAFYENYRVHEQKFELDSLANPILLAWTYWKATNDETIFTPEVWAAFRLALKTMQNEQDHARNSTYTHRELLNNPTARTGMIWTGFRPSDDRCHYNFLIPAEAMAAQALRAMAEIGNIVGDNTTAVAASKLEKEVMDGIKKFGIVKSRDGKTVYAYEVDGLGNAIIMDDANLPSLMSLPIFGFTDVKDPLYQTTRARSLSSKNPFYFSGSLISGIGSPHTPRNMVWPLSLLSQAMTSVTKDELTVSLKNLFAADYGSTGLHESVHVDNPSKFTRPDFGWPNAMFVEMALTTWQDFGELPKVLRTP